MTTFLTILLVILMVLVVASLVRGVVAFLKSTKIDLESGEQIRARHVVVATAFRRLMNANLKQIKVDQSYAGKSVAITSTGDSSNLLIAKLVAHGAQVHLVTNGFIILDKMFATFSPLDDGPRLGHDVGVDRHHRGVGPRIGDVAPGRDDAASELSRSGSTHLVETTGEV